MQFGTLPLMQIPFTKENQEQNFVKIKRNPVNGVLMTTRDLNRFITSTLTYTLKTNTET